MCFYKIYQSGYPPYGKCSNGGENWENIHSATVWSSQGVIGVVNGLGETISHCCFLKPHLWQSSENGISVLCLNWHDLFFTWENQEYEKSAVTLNEVRHELSDKVRELSRSASRASLVEEAEKALPVPTGAGQAAGGVSKATWGPTAGLLEPDRKYGPGLGAAPRAQVRTQLIPSCIFGAEPRSPQRISIGQMNEEAGEQLAGRATAGALLLYRLPGSEERQWGWAGALCCGRCHCLWEHLNHQSSRGCGRARPPLRLRLLSRWAPAVIPSLNTLWRWLTFCFSFCVHRK